MNRLTGFRYFKKACREANQLSKYNNGKRYRVYLFDEYRIWCHEDITRMKNQRVISKHEETGILSKNCFYDTQTGVNTHPHFSNRKL
jgi:hypothetical protein